MRLTHMFLPAVVFLAFLLNPNTGTAQTGNGAPNGRHYNLNIIGVPKAKSADMDGNQGHRIFVKLGSKDESSVRTKINLLQNGDDIYQVLDANGTDGSAIFQLPNGSYSIWIRGLGKPNGRATMTTCAEDLELGEEICSTQSVLEVRSKGRKRFRNVTEELTTIQLDEGSAAALDCGDTQVSLFASCLQDYFWAYDNQGLRLLQVRFYEQAP